MSSEAMAAANQMSEASREIAQAAFLMSQTACAIAVMNGMVAENMKRAIAGEAPAYSEKEFNEVPAYYGIDHNEALTTLRG